jgi:hypothetical protein
MAGDEHDRHLHGKRKSRRSVKRPEPSVGDRPESVDRSLARHRLAKKARQQTGHCRQK